MYPIGLYGVKPPAYPRTTIYESCQRLDGADELLAVDVGTTGIEADYDSASGTLALTGAATVAQYEQVLKTATYNNSSDTPDTTDRLVEFTVIDGQADSETATSTVSVAVADDPPA